MAVALVHHPVCNRLGETSTTAVTPLDLHDFARTAAMYDVAPVYVVHPASAMREMIVEVAGYWREGAGGRRNPGRGEALDAVRLVPSLAEAIAGTNGRVWYTSAAPPGPTTPVAALNELSGSHLVVFGTGWGLDTRRLPAPNGWLSPIEGIGKVRHLSVRAALAVYLDRLRHPAR